MKGLEKLKKGDFNNMSQEWQPDGSVILTLSKRGERKLYRLHIIDLYQPTEAVIAEEEIKEH